MKKVMCMIALAAVSFSTVYASAPVNALQQQQQDTSKTKKKDVKKDKTKKDTTMKKDTAKM